MVIEVNVFTHAGCSETELASQKLKTAGEEKKQEAQDQGQDLATWALYSIKVSLQAK